MHIEPATFFCPFPSDISPFAVDADSHAVDWACQQRLVREPAARARLAQAVFGTITARVYPGASREALLFITEWITWLWLYDDGCEKDPAGGSGALVRAQARLIAVLEGAQPYLAEPAMLHALAAWRDRMRSVGNPECTFRFVRSVELYLLATRWEHENRACGVVPDLATYLRMRRHTGCVYPCLELIDVSAGVDLPSEVRDHDAVQRLGGLANDVICHANDIVSFQREVRLGETHNLVAVLMSERGVSQHEALRLALAMHDRAAAEFVQKASRLPSFGARVDAELGRYVDGLRAWMRGNLDWSFTTARYRDEVALAEVA